MSMVYITDWKILSEFTFWSHVSGCQKNKTKNKRAAILRLLASCNASTSVKINFGVILIFLFFIYIHILLDMLFEKFTVTSWFMINFSFLLSVKRYAKKFFECRMHITKWMISKTHYNRFSKVNFCTSFNHILGIKNYFIIMKSIF